MKPKNPEFLLILFFCSLPLFGQVTDTVRRYEGNDAVIMRDLNKISLAEKQIKYITEHLPNLSDPQLVRDLKQKLASLYYFSGRVEESQGLYYSLAEIENSVVTHWPSFFQYIHVLLDRGYSQKARDEIETALKYRKGFASENIFPLLAIRVKISLAFGEYSEALHLLDKYRTLDIHEESPELYYLYFLTCSSADWYDKWEAVKAAVFDKKLLELAQAYESGALKPYPHPGSIRSGVVTSEGTVYQAGAYGSKKTAETVLSQWKDEGYNCWIENENNFWKIRVRLTDKEYEREKREGKELFPVSF